MQPAENKIKQLQNELSECLKYLTDEQKIIEVKELLNSYYQNKLDAAIDIEAAEHNPNSSIESHR